MIKPRSLMLLIVLCMVAPLFGQPACQVCRAEFNTTTNEMRHFCGNPPNNDWGSEACTVTIDGDSITCTSEPPFCYYTEVPACPDANENGICDRNEPIGTCGPEYPPDQCASPIVIVLDGSGNPQLSDESTPVRFDINADGVPDRITWTMPGTAFLALDRNGNGVIDDGRELFGNHSSPSAWNGFIYLSGWDHPPANGTVDESDPVWPDLLLWNDLNHDAISQPSELTRLAHSGITALGYDYDVRRKEDQAGNQLKFRADFWWGTKKDKFWDVYFQFVPNG